jgi:DNA-directed RNA polymerase omega subunit
MGYQPLEELLPKSGMSVYKLVRIASKRALEISETGNKMVTMASDAKLTTVALEEIRQGKVYEEEAGAAMMQAKAIAAKNNKK